MPIACCALQRPGVWTLEFASDATIRFQVRGTPDWWAVNRLVAFRFRITMCFHYLPRSNWAEYAYRAYQTRLPHCVDGEPSRGTCAFDALVVPGNRRADIALMAHSPPDLRASPLHRWSAIRRARSAALRSRSGAAVRNEVDSVGAAIRYQESGANRLPR